MTTAGATTPVKGQRKTKIGRVVSDKMDKTIVVSVERLTRHPLYKRVMKADDEVRGPRRAQRRPDRRHRPHRGVPAAVRDEALAARVRPRRRAGEERAGESIVSEEAETTEAIHGSAHPGRRAEARTRETAAGAAGEVEA